MGYIDLKSINKRQQIFQIDDFEACDGFQSTQNTLSFNSVSGEILITSQPKTTEKMSTFVILVLNNFLFN